MTVIRETKTVVMFWDGSVLNDENCYNQFNSVTLEYFRVTIKEVKKLVTSYTQTNFLIQKLQDIKYE